MMGLEWFTCPDKQNIPVQDCLACKTVCRYGDVCLTQPTRYKIAEEREWSGEPSTTQMINGTIYEFLKLTQPYAVDPDSRMFALLGTRHHETLKEVADKLGIVSEVAMTGEDKDIFDLLEVGEDSQIILTDYKTWGSYRVAKALGLVETGKKPDPSGTTYKTSGRWGKAGSPKMVSVFQSMAQEIDNFEAELQLNHYRLMLKQKFNIEVTKMRLQVTVRDGGLGIATSRGIDTNSKMIAVRRLKDVDVESYFNKKRTALLLALEQGKWSEPCNNQECWDGQRCARFCEVAMFCTKGTIEHQGG